VPRELIDQLQQHRHELGESLQQCWEGSDFRTAGSWEEIFGGGPETDEIFMAWHYARYVDAVAAAGKAEYDLPMFVNAWLSNPREQQPGDWPSGGPVPAVFDIWRTAAPHIDLLTPDIYAGDFQAWCRQYTRRGNPLFIPEMRRDEEGARNVFYAIGAHDAIGVSPFAIDSLDPPADAPLRQSYALLRQLAPLILEHQGTGAMAGFVLDAEHPSITRELGGYALEITLDHSYGYDYKAEHGYGLVIANGPGEFTGAGYGFQIKFRPTTPGPALVGIAAVDEGEYRGEQWMPGRRLNGDETAGGEWWRFSPAGERTGRTPMSGPGAGISRCTVYRYE
jgi:hypothetical protein